MVARLNTWRLLTLAWAAHIFWMSTDAFRSERSRPLLARLLDLLHINVSTQVFWILHTTVRKAAHMIEYGILAFLLYRSLEGRDRLSWQPQLAGWSIVAAAAYSVTDELHQVFVRGRGASLIDCCLDTIGAAIAMLLVYWSAASLEARAGGTVV